MQQKFLYVDDIPEDWELVNNVDEVERLNEKFKANFKYYFQSPQNQFCGCDYLIFCAPVASLSN